MLFLFYIRNDRYLVQDYCPRDKVYVTIGNASEAPINPLANPLPRPQPPGANNGSSPSVGLSKRQKRPSTSLLGFKGGPRHHTTTPEVPENLFKSPEALQQLTLPSANSLSSVASSTVEVPAAAVPPSPPLSPSRLASVRLKRSGSSLSSKSVPTGASSFPLPSATIHRDLPLLLYIYLTESQSGTCTEFCLAANNRCGILLFYLMQFS